MAASATDEGWTVVLRKKNKNSNKPVIITRTNPTKQHQKQGDQQWMPLDIVTDPDRESRLMLKIQSCLEKLENSEFFRSFMDQMLSPDMQDGVCRVLGSEKRIQMVIYGIGSVESYEPPRMQLSLAVLMKRRFDWIGDIEVFDPIISLVESKVLASLGCAVLSINEQGRRQALRPTLFFMPHCEAELYDNLLETNWGVDGLSRIVVFGNSFGAYEQHASVCNSSSVVSTRKHILAVRRFTQEFGVRTFTDDCFRAFQCSSWHFFSPGDDSELDVLQCD